MINFLLLLIFIVFPLGQLTKLSIGSEEINIYLQDLLVAGLVLIWLIGQIGRKKSKVFPPLTKPILFFVVMAIISLLVNSFRLSQRELIISSFYLLRWVVYAGVYFVVYDLTRFQGFKVSRLQGGLILAGVLAAIFGLFQYFLYPDLRNLSYLGWDPHKFRAFGTFFDPNFLGIILVLTIILILDSRQASQGHPLLKPFALLRGKEVAFKTMGILGAYLTLALTYSRASYLAYFTGLGLISFFRKTPRLFLGAVLIGLLTLLLLPKPQETIGVDLGREDTITSRINNWKQSIVIVKDRPFFGVGFNSYRYAQKDDGFLKEENSHAGAGGDSSLLFVLATTGALGFLCYLSFLRAIWGKGDLLIRASLTAIIVHSFFNNTLFYPAVMLWMWIIIGGPRGNK